MFSDQNVLVVTICVLVGLLIWGRWRYDAVTLVALAALVLFEVIPINSAFSGFGHCLLYTSPSPRDMRRSRMPSSA